MKNNENLLKNELEHSFCCDFKKKNLEKKENNSSFNILFDNLKKDIFSKDFKINEKFRKKY